MNGERVEHYSFSIVSTPVIVILPKPINLYITYSFLVIMSEEIPESVSEIVGEPIEKFDDVRSFILYTTSVQCFGKNKDGKPKHGIYLTRKIPGLEKGMLVHYLLIPSQNVTAEPIYAKLIPSLPKVKKENNLVKSDMGGEIDGKRDELHPDTSVNN